MTFYQQTEYSLLDNLLKLNVLINKAKEYNYQYLTITDNNLYGYYKFYNECLKNNINPIIGLKKEIIINNKKDILLFYALNNKGFKELLKLNINNELKYEDLYYLKDCLIITSGPDSILNLLLYNNYLDEAKSLINNYKILNNFYIGLSLQTKNDLKIEKELVYLSKENNIKLVPIIKTSYLNKNDLEYLNYLRKIDKKESVYGDYHLHTLEEINESFKNHQDVLKNFVDLVKDIKYDFNYKITLPKYDEKISSRDYLKELSLLGLKKRIKNNHLENKKIYYDRLKYELEVITKMHFDDYFLIVYDYVKYAKKNGILVGPGRGSASGSLVSYCLGITNIDPIKYNLLFERFLNSERISMPDIDIDFEDQRRDEIIYYLNKRYGKNHVSYIVTFGEFLIKSSIRDIARILDIKNSKLNELLKFIDKDVNNVLELLNKEEVKYLYDNDDEIHKLITLASKIEGLPRHISTHAAGIVLSNEDLLNLIPLNNTNNDYYQTQVEASDLEKIGFIKFDLLAIRNLTFINNIVKRIKNDNPSFNLDKIPLDEKKVYEQLQKGETTGIFQLESYGIRNVLRKVKPEKFEDIALVLALYRPSAMANIDEYVRRKNTNNYNSIHPLLDDILKETYGIIIYQEQTMAIARKIANYSLGQADILRRAIGKKDLKLMESQKEIFINNAIKNNVDEQTAIKIFDYIEKFASYGFNKSHSVSYALVSYQMMYLKMKYPLYFMCEMLSNVIGNSKQLLSYFNECKKYNIKLYSPSINYSNTYFDIYKDGIIIPLLMVKNIGLRISSDIINERKKGLFKSYGDFINRINIDKKTIEYLIFAGFFDEFKITKKEMIDYLESNKYEFDSFNSDIIKKKYQEYDKKFLIKRKKEVLGI